MTTTTTVSPTLREPHLLGQTVVVIGGSPGIGLETARRARAEEVAWSYVPLEESDKAFGRLQSFVAGPPKNGVQFMVKDSRKYASTGGWGFAQFNDGKPADEAVHKTCFSCHEIVKARDLVFNRYAP
jgi:hypothetical protein